MLEQVYKDITKLVSKTPFTWDNSLLFLIFRLHFKLISFATSVTKILMKASDTILLFTNIYSNFYFLFQVQKSSKKCHIPWPLTCFQSKGSIHISAKVSVKFFHPNSGLLFLFERAFEMMKNGVYFNVIALLVAELFKILIYEIKWLVTSQQGQWCEITKNWISLTTFSA